MNGLISIVLFRALILLCTCMLCGKMTGFLYSVTVHVFNKGTRYSGTRHSCICFEFSNLKECYHV